MKRGLMALTLAVVASVLSGCNVPGYISKEDESRLMKRVATRPYVAGIEGLGAGGFARELTDSICRDLDYGGCTTAGNPIAHMPLIREAKRNGQKIYVVGHSLGGNEAIKLSRLCKDEKITIDGVYVLDITFPEQVPENVLEVVDEKGTVPYAFRGRELTMGDLENKKTHLVVNVNAGADHFDLPMRAKSHIEKEILNGSD